MSKQIRVQEIRRKQRRQKKLKLLKAKFQVAKTKDEQNKILLKIQKIAPWLSEKDLFLKEKK